MKTLYKTTLFFILLFSAVNIFAQQTEREKGFALYEKGEYQKAVETLQKAVEADADDQKSWLYLGMSNARLENKSEAVKAFKKAEKTVFKEEKAGENQTPLKIISKPQARYTDAARSDGIQGTIKVAVEFGADGKIKEIFPYRTLSGGLNENVVAAVEKIRFEPATRDGKTVLTIKILSYTFTIY
jgi:TonB family protein